MFICSHWSLSPASNHFLGVGVFFSPQAWNPEEGEPPHKTMSLIPAFFTEVK